LTVGILRRLLTDKKAVHLQALRALHGEGPMPFAYWSAAHRLSRSFLTGEDRLFSEAPPVSGMVLTDSRLREVLGQDELGGWSLYPAVIELLWRQLHQHRPRVIVECGAGASTLVMGQYLATNGVTDGVSVSIEQSAVYRREVEARLVQHQLERWCKVLHAPLSAAESYEVDMADARAALGSRAADFLFIDGPSGRPGCRVWTLPALAPLCRPGARWFLDDAFRDGEMAALQAWSRLPGVTVTGIHPVLKGLATGVIDDPDAVTFEAVARAAGVRPPALSDMLARQA
jgi:hypothetical protein